MQLKKTDIILMAFTTGLIVANIYYCQPLIILIAKEFNIAESDAGRITYLTQAGYALGLLFLVPLGDRLERKTQILYTTLLAIAALIAAALSPGFTILCIASVIIGFSSVVPQLILPLAAHLAEPTERGKVIGTIMSGLLIGILLSRTLSGIIGQLFGWRAMFWIAAVICSLLMLLIKKRFPESRPTFNGKYKDLMASLVKLTRELPELREASAINALAFSIFGAFWTSMVLLLDGAPYYFRADQIGLFGLAGAMGAMAAPLVGRIGDKKNPRIAVGYGLLILLIALLIFYFFGTHLYLFIFGILLLDLGQQGVHVSNQTRVYALIPEARNRLNTVFMTASFVGTSAGSAMSLALWKWSGWHGVCLGLIVLLLCALAVYIFTYKKNQTANLQTTS
ncbi:MFS transporter [Pedobacter sp. HMF7647]|uniref:MFS transporter n=1 Tax=Hufsiella arboris TaxID=2695275 RepID=A0A7K1Y9H6_9SPHI|nr:MFS transporter [Hufsiella arboris]MXV51235.1 MFS transporter [Hufsiella arboris]